MADAVEAGALRVQTPQRSGEPAPSRELVEAARDFESLLLNMMMKSMRSSVPENDLFGDGSKVRMYEEMRDAELARVMAHRGGIGLAELLVEQLQARGEEGLDALRQAGSGARRAEESYRAQSRLTEMNLIGASGPTPSQEDPR